MTSHGSENPYEVRRSPEFEERWEQAIAGLIRQGILGEDQADDLDRSLERMAGHYLWAGIAGLSIAAVDIDDGVRYQIEFRPPLRIWIEVPRGSTIAYLYDVDVY